MHLYWTTLYAVDEQLRRLQDAFLYALVACVPNTVHTVDSDEIK